MQRLHLFGILPADRAAVRLLFSPGLRGVLLTQLFQLLPIDEAAVQLLYPLSISGALLTQLFQLLVADNVSLQLLHCLNHNCTLATQLIQFLEKLCPQCLYVSCHRARRGSPAAASLATVAAAVHALQVLREFVRAFNLCAEKLDLTVAFDLLPPQGLHILTHSSQVCKQFLPVLLFSTDVPIAWGARCFWWRVWGSVGCYRLTSGTFSVQARLHIGEPHFQGIRHAPNDLHCLANFLIRPIHLLPIQSRHRLRQFVLRQDGVSNPQRRLCAGRLLWRHASRIRSSSVEIGTASPEDSATIW
mmetsp:Transcript_113290/g.225632  ORF Transcript_113290/g.225632 Transcript_113290/m.225632 type:complete len:302 (-) Transcript_113290:291-1196(-)